MLFYSAVLFAWGKLSLILKNRQNRITQELNAKVSVSSWPYRWEEMNSQTWHNLFSLVFVVRSNFLLSYQQQAGRRLSWAGWVHFEFSLSCRPGKSALGSPAFGQGGWSRWPPDIPSNLNNSVILWQSSSCSSWGLLFLHSGASDCLLYTAFSSCCLLEFFLKRSSSHKCRVFKGWRAKSGISAFTLCTTEQWHPADPVY